MSSSYRVVYDRWKAYPIAFWKAAAADIDWSPPPTETYRPDIKPYGRWFVDGVCNTCHNAVARHVAGGRSEQAAIVCDSAVIGTNVRSPTPSCCGRCRPATEQ